MDVTGKRVLILGDSLSAGIDTPGGKLGERLRAAGAVSVRVNGVVSRSAVNFFTRENGAAILAAEAAQNPDIVIVFLGTNDIGMSASSDAAAFKRIAAAFRGAEIWALGPPTFGRVDLNRGSDAVYSTLRRVFGPERTIDTRPMSSDIVTTAQGRSPDGVHFGAGAKPFAERMATTFLTPTTWGNDKPAVSMVNWRWTLAAIASTLAFVGLALVIRRRNLLS